MPAKTRQRKTSNVRSSRSKRSRSRGNDSVASDELSDVLSNVNSRLKEQKEHLRGLTESYQFMSDTFDKLKGQISKLTKESAHMKKEIKTIQSNEKNIVKRIQELEKRGARLKQTDNTNHMIITNMPKLDENVNLKEVVSKIGQQIQHQISDTEIVEVYQSESKGNKRCK